MWGGVRTVGRPAERLLRVSRTGQALLAETEAAYELESRMGTPIDFNGVRSTEVNNGLLKMRRGGTLSVRPGIHAFRHYLPNKGGYLTSSLYVSVWCCGNATD